MYLGSPGGIANAQTLEAQRIRDQATVVDQQTAKVIETTNLRLKDAFKQAAELVKMQVDRGGSPSDPAMVRTLSPLVQSINDTLEVAKRAGIGDQLVVTPTTARAAFQSLLSTPTKEELRKQTELDKTAIARGTEAGQTPTTKEGMVDGKPAFVTDKQIQAGGVTPKITEVSPPTKALKLAFNTVTGDQMNVTYDKISGQIRTMNGDPLPEGYVVTSSSTLTGTPEDFKVTQPVQSNIEEDIVAMTDQLVVLEDTLDKFDPQFLTWMGKAKGKLLDWASKAGVDVSPEQTKYMEDLSVFSRTSFKTVNATIREITGAQMSEKEADRIRREIPDPDVDNPITFLAKAKDAMKEIKLALARKKWMMRNGIEFDFSNKKTEPPVSMDEFKGKIDARAKELQKQNPDMPRDELISTLADEFEL